VILYELLSGKLPFDAASIPELSAKILLEPAEPLNREDVPKALKHAIERTLAKKPGERFPTVAEFSMAIATFGSKRSRQNVERISKILSAAGMSTSQLQLPPTVPPAAPGTLDETRLTLDDIPLDTSEMKREHSSTVSQWGRTNGPAPQPRKSGAGLWVAAGVLVVGVVGAGAFFLLGNSESATANVAAQPTVEPVASPEPDPTLEAPAAEATASAQAEEAANDDGEAAADADETNVEPSATATQTAAPKPTVKKAVPKKSVPRPTPRPVAKPAPKPKSTQPKSQKNKFGSRK
jgi:serine/threonine-protein kinase